MLLEGFLCSLGLAGLGWERLSHRVLGASMFLLESTQVMTMTQMATIGAIIMARNKILKSPGGKMALALNGVAFAFHANRIRTALQAGDHFREALAKGGVRNMKPSMVPMLLALLFPLRSFIPKEQADLLFRTKQKYAILEDVDPQLHASSINRDDELYHKRKLVGKGTLGKVLTKYGRGRVRHWLSMDILQHKHRANKDKLPVLMYIHGGGWVVGDKLFACKSTLEYLCAEMDIIICIINYRMSPEVKFPEQLYDCKRALHWIKNNIHTYGGDPAKICIAGESAGGHLTSTLALTIADNSFNPPEFTGQEDLSICGAIDIYGVHDFTDSEGAHATNHNVAPGKQSAIAKLLEKVVFQTAEPGDLEKASPSHILGDKLNRIAIDFEKTHPEVSNLCPIMLIHGTADMLAAFDDSKSYFERLQRIRKASKSSTQDIFVELPNAPHGFGYLPSPRAVAMALAMEAFITHHTTHTKMSKL